VESPILNQKTLSQYKNPEPLALRVSPPGFAAIAIVIPLDQSRPCISLDCRFRNSLEYAK